MKTAKVYIDGRRRPVRVKYDFIEYVDYHPAELHFYVLYSDGTIPCLKNKDRQVAIFRRDKCHFVLE